jgi:hypothetical protein
MHISFSDIKQVKRLAKQLESTYPTLKLGQRLDKAAAQLLGVRDYHEANRLYDKWLMLHVHQSADASGVSKCSFCEFSFAADLKEDRQAHRKRHEQVVEACDVLGYVPGNFVQRESLKRDGHELVHNGDSLEKRIEGVLLLLRGWFDRSLFDAIYGEYWRKHPTFDEYVAMIQDTLGSRYNELLPTLKDRYGYTPGEIEPGNSSWYPKRHRR